MSLFEADAFVPVRNERNDAEFKGNDDIVAIETLGLATIHENELKQ